MFSFSKDSAGVLSKKGQALALAAVTMVVLIGTAALAVDLGYFFVTRNELQNIADGSALAGARTLGHIYQGLSYQDQQGYYCDNACETAIRDVAQDVGTLNRAAGKDMTVRVVDIAIGQWDGDSFTPTLDQPDAVEVITRRDELANGPVTTFFARVLGIDESAVTAIATAALSGQGTADDGDIELPIGISKWFFRDPNQAFCDDEIVFHPTNDPLSCAGWTSWDYGSNDVNLRHILDEDEGYDSPETIANDTYFNFIGGDLSVPTFDALLSLFQRKGHDTDANYNYLLTDPDDPTSWVTQADPALDYYTVDENGVENYPVKPVELWEVDNQGVPVRGVYPDGTLRNLHRWDTTVPVYDRDDCSNPNQIIQIAGFAPIELRDVLNAPDKLVKGIVRCDYVDPLPSRGGGGEYGIKGSIPGLVR